jgi:hypothetical protein
VEAVEMAFIVLTILMWTALLLMNATQIVLIYIMQQEPVRFGGSPVVVAIPMSPGGIVARVI